MEQNLLGLYIHIPFCIQRCHYCDFATYSKDQISPNKEYVDALLIEAEKRKNLVPSQQFNSIYFGGGTPSLLEASEIDRIFKGLKKLGFHWDDNCEITLEANPATVTEEKARDLKMAGVNRISIGCQSFDNEHLKRCNREHSVEDTLRTIEVVEKSFDNFSLDLLFSLPQQNLEGVYSDLQVIKQINPPHVSAYCLTVAENHPMNQNRCSDEDQVKMFHMIDGELEDIGQYRYEISNFSRPGFESVHNNIYWTDHSYWALGLSAHGYFKNPDFGYRYWNPSTYKTYLKHIDELKVSDELESSYPQSQFEKLRFQDSLTDFCHIHMRLMSGLPESSLRQKFGEAALDQVRKRMDEIIPLKWVEKQGENWMLTQEGLLLSNQVFAKLLFSADNIDNS